MIPSFLLPGAVVMAGFFLLWVIKFSDILMPVMLFRSVRQPTDVLVGIGGWLGLISFASVVTHLCAKL